MKVKALVSSENSVNVYQSTWHNITKDLSLQKCRCEDYEDQNWQFY